MRKALGYALMATPIAAGWALPVYLFGWEGVAVLLIGSCIALAAVACVFCGAWLAYDETK